jgi:RNA polymerase sigma-70 factor (sigma-E family)
MHEPCLCFVDTMGTSSQSPLTPGDGVGDPAGSDADATCGVTALYQAHAVGLIRLAIVMLGERTAAEDVVQDAFFGLYRHWDRLTDPANALNYARSAVLNGCRNALRVRGRPGRLEAVAVAGESAESAALVGEEHQEVLTAIRALPDRQREALVLRYYVDMSEEEIARAMGISRGTVKSTTSRAVAALARMLKEDP